MSAGAVNNNSAPSLPGTSLAFTSNDSYAPFMNRHRPVSSIMTPAPHTLKTSLGHLHPHRPRKPAHARTGRTSQSSSSSTSPDRGPDHDNDWAMMQGNDSQSSMSPSSVSDSDTMQLSRDDRNALLPYNEPPASLVPPEIYMSIFARLPAHDLLNCMLVSRYWARNAVSLLWHRPLMNTWSNVERVVRAMRSDHRAFAYSEMVKRLNLSALSGHVSDGALLSMSQCKRIERLTLTGCDHLTDTSLVPVISGNRSLIAIDLTKLKHVSDRTLFALAENCSQLQGLNATGCVKLTDAGISAVAEKCRLLKRLKVTNCKELTSVSISIVAKSCPSLLEFDLGGLAKVQSPAIAQLLASCKNLRELRLAHCTAIGDAAFARLASAKHTFEALRVLDLTSCVDLTDKSVEIVVDKCPRLRNLLLWKCRHMTDRAVFAITKLGKNLHYVHLGHCTRLTDEAVIYLARSCTRIRYIDLSCCLSLTDASVAELALNLPKLRRIGLVKCSGITNRGIVDLATLTACHSRRLHGNVLERVHLSYCMNLTPVGIHTLLNNCTRLSHLSLSGVEPFLIPAIQAFCRPAPPDFNDHQSHMFCVFSGSGVADLRAYLNSPESRQPLPGPHFDPEQLFNGHGHEPALAQHQQDIMEDMLDEDDDELDYEATGINVGASNADDEHFTAAANEAAAAVMDTTEPGSTLVQPTIATAATTPAPLFPSTFASSHGVTQYLQPSASAQDSHGGPMSWWNSAHGQGGSHIYGGHHDHGQGGHVLAGPSGVSASQMATVSDHSDMQLDAEMAAMMHEEESELEAKRQSARRSQAPGP